MTESPKARLLTATETVLTRDGFEGLTLRAIAREAGVSHGAPLRHFPGLAALLAAVSARGYRDLVAVVDRRLADDDRDGQDPHSLAVAVGRIRRAGAGYVDFAVDHPGVFALMFRPDLCDTTDADYQAAATAAFDQLVHLVRAAQDTGWHSEHDTRHLAGVLWANVHGLAQLWVHGALPVVVPGADLRDLVALSTGLAVG